MSKFGLFLVAQVLTFAAGWLFANVIRPPAYEDVTLAAWAVLIVLALVLGLLASGSPARGRY